MNTKKIIMNIIIDRILLKINIVTDIIYNFVLFGVPDLFYYSVNYKRQLQ